jgi:hypothetical protein
MSDGGVAIGFKMLTYYRVRSAFKAVRALPSNIIRHLNPIPRGYQLFEGSGCFFHDKMIAPVLLISNWLLPPR